MMRIVMVLAAAGAITLCAANGFVVPAAAECVCAERAGCALQGCFANKCKYLCRQVSESGAVRTRPLTVPQSK